MQLLASLLACFLVNAVAVPLYFSSAEVIDAKLVTGVVNDSHATVCIIGSNIRISIELLKLFKASKIQYISVPKAQIAEEGYYELLKYGKVNCCS